MNPPTAGGLAHLLSNRQFLYLWLAQALSQTALNALVYTLLVRVEEWTGSSTALGLLILSFILPSVVMGAAAGVFVDRWRKKRVLIITNLLRALILVGFLVLSQSFILVLIVNLAFAIVTQFFAPAELSAIPAIVPKEQLLVANGLFNLTLNSAQLMGFVILGPILAKSLSGTEVFIVLSALYLICAIFIWLMQLNEPPITKDALHLRNGWIDTMLTELKEGWRLLTSDNSISVSILHLTLVNSLILMIGMLAPGFVSRVLGVRAADAVFVMAPAGIGMLCGLFALPSMARTWTKERIANGGILLISATLILFGLVGQIGPAVLPTSTALHLGDILLPEKTPLITLVMMLAFVLGLSYAFVNISAQTLVQERVPFDLRGRIFAAQFALANAAAIVPLLFLGGLADLIGINVVTYVGAGIVFSSGVFSIFHTRRTEGAL